MKLSEFDGVYCLWQLSGKTDKKWSLLKSVVIEDDYCEGERVDSWPYRNLNYLTPNPKYPQDFPVEHIATAIPNRAITCWSFADGIRFYDHTCDLGDTNPFLMDKLRKLGGWWCPLRDSQDLYFGTEAEVRKLLEAVCKKNSESK